MSDIIEGLFEGMWYKWSCGHCGEVYDEQFDIRGDVLECANCGLENEIVGSM